MSDLLLKATPELLKDWCGPVVFRYPSATDHAGVWFDGCLTPGQSREGSVHLDLSRAECRDRVARVVLAGVQSGGLTWPSWGVRVTPYDLFSLSLGWGLGTDHDPIFKRYRLRRNDNTKLPDGSRLVDAKALLAVARSVLHEAH